MKYLFVINSFGAGGAERSLVELLPAFVERGITPVVACLKAQDVGFEAEARDAGFDVRFLEGRSLIGKARALRKVIRDVRPDLVYTALFDSHIAGRLASMGLKVPVMSNLTNTAYDPARLSDPNVDGRKLRLVRLLDMVTARLLTDHFHAVSQAVKDSTIDMLGVRPDRITVVHRGRDETRLGRASPERRRAARRSLGLSDSDLVVVNVGRLEYQKGHSHLVAAMGAVIEQETRARLLIAGRQGHASEAVEQQIADLGLDDYVRLLGHRSDVAEVLAAADLFAFPSVYEGLGGALIEALALSLPVVASDIPALREVVEDGENAILVAPTDRAALASAILLLLQDPARRTQFGARSRELFEANFGAADAANHLIDLLEKVAGQSERRASRPTQR